MERSKCHRMYIINIFTIHVQVEYSSFPFLPNRSGTTYENLFSIINNLVQLNLRRLMSDFEKASINGLMNVFPQTDHRGCFFHFCRALCRRIVDLGLKN